MPSKQPPNRSARVNAAPPPCHPASSKTDALRIPVVPKVLWPIHHYRASCYFWSFLVGYFFIAWPLEKKRFKKLCHH
jgi:hypothetical protein